MNWILEIVIAVELLVVLLLVGAVFYAIKKGFDEMIKGLESIDERLSQIQVKI